MSERITFQPMANVRTCSVHIVGMQMAVCYEMKKYGMLNGSFGNLMKLFKCSASETKLLVDHLKFENLKKSKRVLFRG